MTRTRDMAVRATYDPKKHCTTAAAAAWAGFRPNNFMYNIAPAFGLTRYFDREKNRMFYDRAEYSAAVPKIKERLGANGKLQPGTLSKKPKRRKTRRRRQSGRQTSKQTSIVQHSTNGNGKTPIQIEVTAENIHKLMNAGVPIRFVMSE